MASSATEEYLQAIYTLADENGSVIAARLATFLGVSAAAVSEMVHRLERDGLVTIDLRKELHFTAAGQTAQRGRPRDQAHAPPLRRDDAAQ